MPQPERDQYSLIITNLTNDQRAIVARQDKMETILNAQQMLLSGNQVLLTTLVEQHKDHEEEMRDMKRDQIDMGKKLVEVDGKVIAIRWVMGISGSVFLVVLSLYLGHFIK